MLIVLVVLEPSCYALLLRRMMRECGYDLCLKCGCWLKGLDGDIKR